MVSKLRRKRFLEKLAEFGTVAKAALAVSNAKSADAAVSPFYRERKVNVEFAEAWDRALEQFADRVEEEIIRRGMRGVDRYVLYRGEKIIDPDTGAPLTKTEYSDKLLELLAKATNEKFRDRKQIDINIDIESRIQKLVVQKNLFLIHPHDLRYLSIEDMKSYYAIKNRILEKRANDTYHPLNRQLEAIGQEIEEDSND